ncbi:Cell division protein FtsH [hydrothermal vent metagenome]|uniref:Cell division protein FtsH n=1 Tax=hydrothermal vent metagenome TaxID=652676 RepID=A0A1W1C015_9ZZZZ
MPTLKLNNRLLIIISALFIALLLLFALLRDNAKVISLRQANELLQSHEVKEVLASKEYIYLKTKRALYKVPKELLTPAMLVDYRVKIADSSWLFSVVLVVLGIGVAFFVFLWRQKGSKKEQKSLKQVSKAAKNEQPSEEIIRPIEAIKTDVTFDDIGGIEDVKEELQEIIDFMKNPTKYKNFGARLPRGVLLVGPPGVGKTMIAKAVANAAGVSFYYQSGASFVQIYVGMGAKRVHELFAVAKKNAPAIIFIDEIDAVGKRRDGNRNDEREATLNQLLTEMDGFESQSGVIVMAATNKIDVLDPALLRAGRFDRRIFVDLPTKNERKEIIKKYLANIPNDVDATKIASITVGFNGATLAAFVNEAALLALRQNHSRVTMEHFYSVKDKVVYGKRKLQILSKEQKRQRVTYQSGKVVVATYYDLPFEKLLLSNERLTPPNADEPMLQSELQKHIKTLLGGIVLCDMRYGEHPSSAKSDLSNAKQIAKEMIDEYGMGSSLVASEDECADLLERLYSEVETLFESFGKESIEKVEAILSKNEAITKKEVQEILHEVL